MLLYALINFVGTVAILKFFRYRAIGDMPREDCQLKKRIGRMSRPGTPC